MRDLPSDVVSQDRPFDGFNFVACAFGGLQILSSSG